MNANANSNKQIVQHIHAELAQGNGRPFIESLAEDFRWIMKGRTAWSGTYEGRQVVQDRLLATSVRPVRGPLPQHRRVLHRRGRPGRRAVPRRGEHEVRAAL